MKRSRISQVATRLVAVGLLLGLVMPSLRAEVECSNADLTGLYTFGGTGVEVVPEALPPLLPEPGAFPASFVGSFIADGDGKITSFKLTENVNTPAEALGFVVLERDPIAEGAVPHIDYTVGPDCAGTISWLDQTMFGPSPTTLRFVLADGGREGFAIPPSPPSALLLTFKRVDAQLEAKVDSLSMLLETVNETIRRMALRLGLVPAE